MWVSDTLLNFGRPVLTNTGYRRNEYLYIGRSTNGILDLKNIRIEGPHQRFFSVSRTSAKIKKDNYIQLKVSFFSENPVPFQKFSARIVITNNVNGITRVEIR